MLPTIISGMKDSSALMQEEIFGPVTCVTLFDEEEEVISRANGVRYGLSATVWSRDVGRVHRVARKLQAGLVWTNCWLVRDLNLPFGGMKNSGIGREGGKDSYHFFTEVKSITIKHWQNEAVYESLCASCVISNLCTNYIEEATRLDMIGNKVQEKIQVLHTVCWGLNVGESSLWS